MFKMVIVIKMNIIVYLEKTVLSINHYKVCHKNKSKSKLILF
jgi:hypothetical protein